MSEFCFHLISWEQNDGFWWNFVYAVLWLTHEIFQNFSTELWPLIDVKISIFLHIFRNNEWTLIKFCLCIDIYDPWCDYYTLFSELFNRVVIDFRSMFMLNILWNNWWIWSNLVDILKNVYAKTCTTKISTVAGYHVVFATLFIFFMLI